MLKNYFKAAWRNLRKNKFYSSINIVGLAVGLAIGIIILLWVQDELSFDGFHRQAKNIYRLENQVGTGSSIQIWSVTNSPIATEAKSHVPEVKDAVRISYNGFYSTYKYGDKLFAETKTYFTDPSFFSVFDFNLMKGDNAKPFTDENSIVITETTARRYFGNQDPLGKVIIGDNKANFTVSGVIRDFPKNSSLGGDIFFPMSLFNKYIHKDRNDNGTIDDDWENFNYETYLLVGPGTSIPALSNTLRNLHLKHEPADTDIKYLLLELGKMHLYKADGSPAGIETVRIFFIVALLILTIACINYVNLSTARSMLRSKEVSLRKIVGANRIQLLVQFIIETTLLFLIAAFFAIVLIYLLMPAFNKISGKELAVDLTNFSIWRIIILSIAATLAVSSIYPALLLSSFEPVKALKGKITAGLRTAGFRKILVVSQFAVSVALIIGTIVISNQLRYIRSKELGYDKTHVFSFWMRGANDHYDAMKNQLLSQPGIADVTRSRGNIVSLGEQTGDNYWDGKGANQTFMLYPLSVDKNFIPFFKLQLVAGKNFTGAVNDSAHFILNETAVREAGIKDPIGKRFKLWQADGTIIGVAKDFHFAPMKRKIEPAVLYYNPKINNSIFIKTSGENAANAIAGAQSVWNQYNAGNPFSYAFLDETFQNLYQSEQRTGTLFNVFAGIAILISCLGLLGLATFTAHVRTREIGVRKVLGASAGGIIRLLATDFIKLVLIAIVIAVPVAWYIMNQWLQDFAYKINIGWAVFVISGLIAITISVITISFQSLKAALANPVKSLRTE